MKGGLKMGQKAAGTLNTGDLVRLGDGMGHVIYGKGKSRVRIGSTKVNSPNSKIDLVDGVIIESASGKELFCLPALTLVTTVP